MRLLWLVACLVALTGSAIAQMWVDNATISPTTTLSPGRICYSDGRDIACDANAPLMSGLGTGSGDRITSGTGTGLLTMTAISATGYISLSTNGTNWGYLSNGVNYLPTLKTNTLSASTAIQVGSNALTCATGISGTMRYSSVSSTMEYCNGSAWTSMGPSSTNVPAFMVTKGGTDQTVAASTFTKVAFSTKVLDTNNNFSACTTNCGSGAQTVGESRFTPTIAGIYLFQGQLDCSGGSAGTCIGAIYKNGSTVVYGTGSDNEPTYPNRSSVTALLSMNGTTDYVELYGFTGAGTTFRGLTVVNYFQGTLIASGNGLAGGGGTAIPAGSTADVQFNSGGSLAADTGVFTYSAGTLKSTSVSATNVSATSLQLSGASVTCAAGTLGIIRRSPTTGRLQVCQ